MFDNFLAMFDNLQKLKRCYAFLVNPSMVDVVNDIRPISDLLVTESSMVEMEQIELQKDLSK